MHDTLIRWDMAIHDLKQIERILHKHDITAQTTSEHAPNEDLEKGVIFDHWARKNGLTLNWRASVQTADGMPELQYVRVRVSLEKQGDDDNFFLWTIDRCYDYPHWILCPTGEAELAPLNPELDKEIVEIQNQYRQDFGVWEFYPEPDRALDIILSFARIFAAST